MPKQHPGEPYYRIGSTEAKTILEDNDTQAVVIDVRREDEWLTGHVSGAIHIPIDDMLDRLDELPDQKILLFICAAGVRSGLACEYAASTGISTELLYNIEDGTPDWIANNYPIDIG